VIHALLREYPDMLLRIMHIPRLTTIALAVITIFVVISQLLLECNVAADIFGLRYGGLNHLVEFLRVAIIINCLLYCFLWGRFGKSNANRPSAYLWILAINVFTALILFLYPIVSASS